MEHEKTLLIDQIISTAKREFDIDLVKEKLLSEEEYRTLVFTELNSLENAELNRLIGSFNQANQTQPSASSRDEVLDSKRNKGLLIAASVAVITLSVIGAWFGLSGKSEQPNKVVAVPAKVVSQKSPEMTKPKAIEAEPEQIFKPLFAIHGSNTIGEKLAPALLKAYFEEQGASDIDWQQGGIATERTMQFDMDGEKLAIGLAAHGSSTAFKALNANMAQIGMSSRKIKTSEIEALKGQSGDLSKLGNEHIIALDGLAIIVNQNNPLKAITTETLSRIFSGEISNWAEIGGEQAPIKVLARDNNSGTFDTFKSLVLKKYGRKLTASAERFESSSELSERVSQDDFAIGFIGLNYIRYSKALAIADSNETKAIYPTRFTIATEDYPLARRLYLYTPTNSATQIKDFANFAISDRGQEIVQSLGLISQSIRVEDVASSELAPDKYNQYAKLAKRLSLNFRFNYATRDLDNKGKRDLQRLVSFVEQNPSKKLVLMGFSDSIGARDKNTLLSLSRAKSVEQELNARGINVYAVEGFGEDMPLANNDNEVGRERNRRVEVWVL
ncbi:substrate-binding domain-containing protein [Pseudoalteromonas piratica]|uniref:Cell envelope biogenesis protein OmpA n=1 Tax=Pseudoalteromonas piratica TaxID=1348114 RepID=A0A0A7EIY8_9GAMM|nr:phosphate ABC transporter substrate-binding/OmpA family protein [Pseudoalteromonas piratica]AIY66518.1 cell envelope biogenesis protein OmpA [Pseudoalteromonas piratica]